VGTGRDARPPPHIRATGRREKASRL
jgi:hypothetical protein